MTAKTKTTKSSLLLAALIFGTGLRLYFAFATHYISPDGTHYALLGYNLWHSGQFVSGGSQFPDIIQPPLYPALLGILTFVFSQEHAGKLLSVVVGLLLIFYVDRFLRKNGVSARVSAVAAFLLAVNPALVAVSSQVASDALFLLLIWLTLQALHHLARSQKDGEAAKGGLFVGLASLTRPEALAFWAVSTAFVAIVRKKMRPVFLFLLTSGVFIVAYSAVSSSVLQQFTLSPKIDFVRVHGQLTRYFQNSKSGLTPKRQLQQVRYSLAPDKKQLAANALFFGDPRTREWIEKNKTSRKNWQGFFKFVALNAYKLVKKLFSGLLLPLGYWALLAIGLLVFPWKKRRLEVGLAVVFVLPLSFVLLSSVEERFLLLGVVLASPVMALGFDRINQRLVPLLKGMSSGVLLTVVLLSALPGFARLYQQTTAKDYYFKTGQWLKQKVVQKARICSSVPQAPFFAGMSYVVLPFAPLDSLQLYLQDKSVDFILLEDKDRLRRPVQLRNFPQFLKKEGETIIDNNQIILLRVIKEYPDERKNANH